MPKTVHLHTPITEEQIRSLELDDIVYVSGDAYCMLYADHYTLIMDMLDRGEEIPMDLKDSVIYNTGVIWRRTPEGGYDMRALGATETMLPHACAYGRIILMGAPIMCCSFVLNCVLRAEGAAVVSMVGLCAGGLINIEKYMFIMDVCECVYEELKEEDYDKVKQAYKEYREAGNPPIPGEDGDEIDYE